MIPLSFFPPLNATLNGLSAALLIAGFVLIRQGRKEAHRACMVSALAVSALFLISYLAYHAQAGSTRYAGEGALRGLYLAILVSHSILAAVVPPMAILTVWRALKGQFDRHRRLARVTFPIWLYVSVTGVVIYLMLRSSYASS